MITLSFFYRLSDCLLWIFLKINVNLFKALCSQIRYMLKKISQSHGTKSVLVDRFKNDFKGFKFNKSDL